MPSTRTAVPWPELSALGALLLGVAAWSASGRSFDLRGATMLGLAVLVALAPRRLSASAHAGRAEAIAVAAALGGVAIGTAAAGFDAAPRALRIVHALAAGELLGLSTMLAFAQPMRAETLRRAALPAVAVAAVAAAGWWPGVGGSFPGSLSLAPASAAVAVILHVAALKRPTPPSERARAVFPAFGVAALAAATLVRSVSAGGAELAWSVGVAAHVLGLVAAHGRDAAQAAAPFSRRVTGAAAAMVVGAATLAFIPSSPLAAMAVALVAAVLFAPSVGRLVRPADGRLLDACDRIDHGLGRAEALDELAAAVLDPLREAARNLRAPAAFWVLDGSRSLRVDVAGTPSSSPLSIDAEKALITWLRTCPEVVFVDVLRPHLVRRPELRPVADALDAHGAFAAIPLTDAEGLLGAVLVPRGDRTDVPTYEEERRLAMLRGSVEGALLRILSAERSMGRAREALEEAARESLRATDAESEVARLGALVSESSAVRAVGTEGTVWVGYARTTRALDARITALAASIAPVALVAAPGVSVVAAAHRLHARSARGSKGFLTLDAASLDPRDTLVALAGDARGPSAAGWLERAAGATLVVENAMALGHDALTTLAGAVERGTSRRLGAERGYAVDVQLVLGLPRPPRECDLPASLLARVGDRWAEVPTLRSRTEDLDSLAFLAVDRACRTAGRSPLGIGASAMAALRAYPWPGELPELEAALRAAVASAHGSRIEADDLPATVRASVYRASLDDDDVARLDD